jgi:hypothetical protein
MQVNRPRLPKQKKIGSKSYEGQHRLAAGRSLIGFGRFEIFDDEIVVAGVDRYYEEV